MLLREFFETTPPGWQDVQDDHSQPKWGESRKTKLLLREINKLRRMQEIQAYERAVELKKIRKQYSPSTEGGPTL
jgi:predicted dithiol-disulfide oxidoreductase (DUF899 family)